MNLPEKMPVQNIYPRNDIIPCFGRIRNKGSISIMNKHSRINQERLVKKIMEIRRTSTRVRERDITKIGLKTIQSNKYVGLEKIIGKVRKKRYPRFDETCF